MCKASWLIAAALALLSVVPATAQRVISNPGWCAQFYPNANCQNYGPGNPYTSYGWATNDDWARRPCWHYHHHYRHDYRR